jgi:TP901-1 family phage major tail protein
MAASVGRAVILNWGNTSPATEIGGLREKSIELNGEPIDITSDDDAGWRSLLADPAEQQINISLSGVSKDDTLKTVWFSNDRIETVHITFGDGSSMLGSFYLATYSETGTYNEATVFECELQSTGVIAFTPAA